MAAWIRIHIPNADPDLGGPKKGLNWKEKNASKRQIIRHKKDNKNQCIKWVNVNLFSF
jgi:hypothetical protein